MEITNKAKRPIVVPLPGGRKLFLGLGQSAKLAPNAVDHPPVKHLVESGDAELKEKKSKKGKAGSSGKPNLAGAQTSGGKAVRWTGDR